MLAAGDRHTCGLTLKDGRIVCWGLDDVTCKPPVGSSFETITAGGMGTCVLDKGGRASCWGRSTIVLGVSEEPLSSITIAPGWACGITIAGQRAVCWGSPAIRVGEQQLQQVDVHQKSDPTPVLEIASAPRADYMCVVHKSGKLVCRGDADMVQKTPQGKLYDQVRSGEAFACARRRTGQIDCWDGAGEISSPPLGDMVFAQWDLKYAHGCGVTSEGEVR